MARFLNQLFVAVPGDLVRALLVEVGVLIDAAGERTVRAIEPELERPGLRLRAEMPLACETGFVPQFAENVVSDVS